jgi:hypothetical protein
MILATKVDVGLIETEVVNTDVSRMVTTLVGFDVTVCVMYSVTYSISSLSVEVTSDEATIGKDRQILLKVIKVKM